MNQLLPLLLLFSMGRNDGLKDLHRTLDAVEGLERSMASFGKLFQGLPAIMQMVNGMQAAAPPEEKAEGRPTEEQSDRLSEVIRAVTNARKLF